MGTLAWHWDGAVNSRLEQEGVTSILLACLEQGSHPSCWLGLAVAPGPSWGHGTVGLVGTWGVSAKSRLWTLLPAWPLVLGSFAGSWRGPR